jgi:prepilin-type N-terminal cleavage/methylation domain-containing protein
MRQTTPRSAPAGFTLVELLIVVVILAILAAVVIPVANNVSNEAEQSSFATDVSIFATAYELYFQVNDDWPPDSGSGAIPSGIDKYLRASDWTKGTPLGGVWDSEKDSFGITSAFGVHFMGVTPKPTAYMTQLDALFDDGDLNTGVFQQIANDRFYYIVRE